MSINDFPLREVTIAEVYNSDTSATYEIPIYQRNYAWGHDEIEALVRDVHDAMTAGKPTYYIGTLVTFNKGDRTFEVIDGQQRLTTIFLMLRALGLSPTNRLTYRARTRATTTLKYLGAQGSDGSETDAGLLAGFSIAKQAIGAATSSIADKHAFAHYFLHQVHIIHYQVPRDIDLNHYFEVMNSRGEQLEQHEIVKAQLISKLSDAADRDRFAAIWNACSKMNVYVQQAMQLNVVFGNNLCDFVLRDFSSLPAADDDQKHIPRSIDELIGDSDDTAPTTKEINEEPEFTFQPIIDFPNFLLTVLKAWRMNKDADFVPADFTLDDKELIGEFHKAFSDKGADSVKSFGYTLLKAKFLLDNRVVHHSNENDTLGNNPWKLEYWHKNESNKGYFSNVAGDSDTQQHLVHLLSMFEVSFTARQRKNYLFYTIFYLLNNDFCDTAKYCEFLQRLARKYLMDVYLERDKLNEINTPLPSSFDEVILSGNNFSKGTKTKTPDDFNNIFGDGSEKSAGIPAYVFNYLDYKLWSLYATKLRGERAKEKSPRRNAFFKELGCSDFGLELFNQFYFSRTRRTLEHYYPQANVARSGGLVTEEQINCFGNYAMIGSAANSSGSNWTPRVKLDHYMDSSGKIPLISVASLKFMIMMQKCRDNATARPNGQEWTFPDIQAHQQRMVHILLTPDP